MNTKIIEKLFGKGSKKIILSSLELEIIRSALYTQISVLENPKHGLNSKDHKEFLKRTRKLAKELERL